MALARRGPVAARALLAQLGELLVHLLGVPPLQQHNALVLRQHRKPTLARELCRVVERAEHAFQVFGARLGDEKLPHAAARRGQLEGQLAALEELGMHLADGAERVERHLVARAGGEAERAGGEREAELVELCGRALPAHVRELAVRVERDVEDGARGDGGHAPFAPKQ